MVGWMGIGLGWLVGTKFGIGGRGMHDLRLGCRFLGGFVAVEVRSRAITLQTSPIIHDLHQPGISIHSIHSPLSSATLSLLLLLLLLPLQFLIIGSYCLNLLLCHKSVDIVIH